MRSCPLEVYGQTDEDGRSYIYFICKEHGATWRVRCDGGITTLWSTRQELAPSLAAALAAELEDVDVDALESEEDEEFNFSGGEYETS